MFVRSKLKFRDSHQPQVSDFIGYVISTQYLPKRCIYGHI